MAQQAPRVLVGVGVLVHRAGTLLLGKRCDTSIPLDACHHLSRCMFLTLKACLRAQIHQSTLLDPATPHTCSHVHRKGSLGAGSFAVPGAAVLKAFALVHMHLRTIVRS